MYADIGGMDIQKQEVREAVELPLTHFELYKQVRYSYAYSDIQQKCDVSAWIIHGLNTLCKGFAQLENQERWARCLISFYDFLYKMTCITT